METERFLDKPIAEVKIKTWHLLALLGGVGIVAWLIFRKKAEPDKGTQSSPAGGGTAGFESFAALGEQIEPLYDGNPLVDKVRAYAQKGWTVFKVPTGQENVMSNRERFPVHVVYAAPPGVSIPARAIRVPIKA